MFLYSGQSSQGFELFALEPSLRHLASVPDTLTTLPRSEPLVTRAPRR